MRRFLEIVFCFGILSYMQMATAQITLPPIIGDGMVIQRGIEFPVWGWAKAGQKVQIKPNWQSGITATANHEGRWFVKIAAPPASGPYELQIKGDNTVIAIRDILCGEVWLACGQSNMEMPLGNISSDNYPGIDNYRQEIAEANYPSIRFFTPAYKKKHMPQTEFDGRWVLCSPESAKYFSAVEYFFGRRLHKELKVPIGLINSSFGGSYIEEWMTKQTLQAYPDCSLPAERSDYPLYDVLIAPLIPYGIRGVILYQGESNATRAYQYNTLFSAMIHSWRKKWSQGDFPFYFVQIAPCGNNRYPPMAAAELRQAQLLTHLAVPNTGMVVTTDLVDDPCAASPDDLHPGNKQDVGKRLALWALAKTYGRDIAYSGPLYRSFKIEGNKIRLCFEHTDGGLIAAGNGLGGFSIAGADKQFADAKAEIDGNTVVVWSEKVQEPNSVRFGWDNVPQPSLFNAAGLPASPFCTNKQ